MYNKEETEALIKEAYLTGFDAALSRIGEAVKLLKKKTKSAKLS